MATKVYDANAICEKLKTDDRWLIRGILAIYARQTADEQNSQATKYHNGVGFNGRDAAFLSSVAKQIRTWQATDPQDRRYPQPLSYKQLDSARRSMLKYAGQLARIAEENNPPVEDDEVREPAAFNDVDAKYQADLAAAVARQQAEDRAERERAQAEAVAEREAIQEVDRLTDLVCTSEIAW